MQRVRTFNSLSLACLVSRRDFNVEYKIFAAQYAAIRLCSVAVPPDGVKHENSISTLQYSGMPQRNEAKETSTLCMNHLLLR
jgi:hypothetical protein